MAVNWREDWKRDLGKLLARSIIGILCAAGVIFLLSNGKDFMIALKPAHDVEDLMENGGAREGMHVTGQVPCVYECFANMSDLEESHISEYYYALPAADGVLILGVSGEQHAAVETLWEETLEYLENGKVPASAVPVEGYIVKAQGRLPYLLTEYLEEAAGYTREELEDMGEPLMIRDVAASLQKARIYAPVGVILLSSGILLLMLYIFLKRRKFDNF